MGLCYATTGAPYVEQNCVLVDSAKPTPLLREGNGLIAQTCGQIEQNYAQVPHNIVGSHPRIFSMKPMGAAQHYGRSFSVVEAPLVLRAPPVSPEVPAGLWRPWCANWRPGRIREGPGGVSQECLPAALPSGHDGMRTHTRSSAMPVSACMADAPARMYTARASRFSSASASPRTSQ